MDHICIEFSNKCDHASMLYQTGFSQRIFLDANIVKNKPEIEQEGYKDGEGNFIKTFEREQKIFKIEILAYEFMLDALSLIPSHDNIILHLPNDESETIKDLSIESEYVTSGVAKVIMTFRTRYVIKNNCCSNLSLVKCFSVNHNPIIRIITDTSFYYTAPLSNGIKIGDRFIVNFLSLGIMKIMMYKHKTGTSFYYWKEEVSELWDVVYNTTTGYNYTFNSKLYVQCPSLLTATSPLSGRIKLTGFAFQNSFVTIQYKKVADASWIDYTTISFSSFNNYGWTISGLTPATSYAVRILNYNHNCNYGYSNALTIITI